MRRSQFELTQLIRNYFGQQGFLDVLTPPAVENPGMEVHVHPFQLTSVKNKKTVPLYLHTSPEFCLKEILATEDIDRLFSISYCFRDEPSSPIHRSQFVMLEWYRKHERYEAIMDDVENLIRYCLERGLNDVVARIPSGTKMVRKTMQEIFEEFLGIDILHYLTVPAISELLKTFPDVPVPGGLLEWDDYFFLLFLNCVEPKLRDFPLLMITEYPAPLSALSTLKTSDPRVCERFEVYVKGIELCNAYNELTDLTEQKKRFTEQKLLKSKLYGYELPSPTKFYAALERGLPPSSGIALGVERLLTSLFEIEQPFFY